jgi:catechol 2,3-dioxygenase-like lactoylglutathione lyase family enzyme
VTVPARISLVTLGVSDLARSRTFYEALGWERVGDTDGVAFFRTGGAILSLYPLEALAEDAHLPVDRTGFSGVSLAINLPSVEAVDAAFAAAAAIGATVLKPAEHVFWGGYSGYFADPDGHTWEIAYNPHWPLDADGLPQLP